MLDCESDLFKEMPVIPSTRASMGLFFGASGALGASSCLGGCGFGASAALRKMSAAVGAAGLGAGGSTFFGAGGSTGFGAGFSTGLGATGAGAGLGEFEHRQKEIPTVFYGEHPEQSRVF